jgi:hypothetical protein
MNYPLTLTFKVLAIARQLSLRDAGGNLVCYVRQRAFKLKEAVTVFADEAQTTPLYTMAADRVIDFSAQYHFADAHGRRLGSVKRQGMRSLWKARYEVQTNAGRPMTIQEANPWAKVLDSVVGEIPVVGMFTGYLFHPAYVLSGPSGEPLLRLEKQPAFFEGRFRVDKLGHLGGDEETVGLLSLVMVILLERRRG